MDRHGEKEKNDLGGTIRLEPFKDQSVDIPPTSTEQLCSAEEANNKTVREWARLIGHFSTAGLNFPDRRWGKNTCLRLCTQILNSSSMLLCHTARIHCSAPAQVIRML